MPKSSNKITQFWQELKRRKVVRRNMVYAATGFVIFEFVSNLAVPFGLPDWTLKLVFIILCIGFVFSIILSWFYDITPDGLERLKFIKQAKDVPPEKPSRLIAWKIATYISAVIIVGFIIFNIAIGPNRPEYLADLEKSIAVLPFENMSVDEEYSHMGDAITDEIILELQKIKEFDRVLSRTSTMQYKDNRPTIPEIADKLGVNYIIEGSIQRHKEDVSIRVQVIRAAHEDHVWADEYNGKWEDIFSIQDEMAFKVANELRTVLSPEEIEQIDKQPTDNIEAYDLYLRGRYFWNKRTKEDLNKSIEFFEQAIEKDTNYALAYAGLADTYVLLAFYEWYLPQQEAYLKGKEFALEALEIDNTLAEAYASLGFVKLFHEWDWNGALKDFKRAVQLNPDYETAHYWYAAYLSAAGQHDEAIAEVKRAQYLDPFSPTINWVASYLLFYARRYDQAIEESLKSLNISPDLPQIHEFLGLSYLQKGMFAEAILAMQKAVRYSGDDLKRKPYDLKTKAHSGICLMVRQSIKPTAQEILNGLIETSKEEYVPSIAFAHIYIGLGDNDNAISWLEKAYEEQLPGK